MQTSKITVALGYHPPYRWEGIISFLSMRAIPGVEMVADGKYMRAVRLAGREGKVFRGWIVVGNNPKRNTLSVTLSDTLIPVLPQTLARVKRLFDLYCEPDVVYETLQVMNDIQSEPCVPGIRVPGCFDTFEMAVRAILGQQITVKAASTLAGKIAGTYGTSIETGIDGLIHTFPEAGDISALYENIEERLGVLGVIASRSRCILALANALECGEIKLAGCMEPELEMKKLMKIKGIGSWTAKYIAMRTMEWPDAFLETDIGIKHTLPDYTPKGLLTLSEKWRPWRSYATMNLWNSL